MQFLLRGPLDAKNIELHFYKVVNEYGPEFFSGPIFNY